jgi:hypothetical protein
MKRIDRLQRVFSLNWINLRAIITTLNSRASLGTRSATNSALACQTGHHSAARNSTSIALFAGVF